MLRYPVDAAHSLHTALWSHGHENMRNFEDAWQVQAKRLAGEHMPPHWPDPATLQYGAIYRYAAQVRRLLRHVSARQLHFVVYEDFFAAARHHYGAVLEFLNLPADSNAAFPIINPAIGARSRLLDGLLRKPPAWVKALYAPVRPLVRATGLNPAAIAWELNHVPRQKSGLRPQFRAELERYFADDIAQLESLLGRRLWRQPSPASARA
jgi:hypothetical protein